MGRLARFGFGWLYKNEPELTKRLGYASSNVVSRIAEITTTGPDGSRDIDVSYNPTRGDILLRRMTVRLPDQPDWKSQVSIPNATSPDADRIVSTACQSMMIPHQC